MRVGIDSSICSGHGRCYVLHPELFESDEEGFGRVIDVDTPEPVARGALLDCPEGAIVLDGSPESVEA
jgi:ferredoxin